MPVLPAVPSTRCPPGSSVPSRSAVSTIETAMRSLIEFPGFCDSSLRKSWQGPVSIRRTSSIGVLPIISITLPKTGARGLVALLAEEGMDVGLLRKGGVGESPILRLMRRDRQGPATKTARRPALPGAEKGSGVLLSPRGPSPRSGHTRSSTPDLEPRSFRPG